MAEESKQPDPAQAVQSGEQALDVKIYAPFQVYFEGKATSVSAENATGPFDILPKHRNFLCMLIPCNIRVASLNGAREIPVHRALMHVKANKVVVFVDV